MKLKLSNDQIANVAWVQWVSNKSDEPRAHAVDPTSVARTGKLRTMTGALIPDHAEPAKPETPRDAFSQDVLARAREVNEQREQAAAERALKRKPREDGVHCRGDVAEVWVGGQVVGSFARSYLTQLCPLIRAHEDAARTATESTATESTATEAPAEEAPKARKPRKSAAA